jgi:hypothetical protein
MKAEGVHHHSACFTRREFMLKLMYTKQRENIKLTVKVNI